jgi:endonuclease/exonuclease/phosphatase family metal-dependent hydrolase
MCKGLSYSLLKLPTRFHCLKGIFLLVVCVPNLPAKAITSEDLELRVMTFNIRNSYARDGENDWKYRKELVYQTIRDYSPAILGLQEANHAQQNELLTALPEYEFVGIGAKGETKGQYCSILYLKNRFKVDKTKTYWLSDTPTVPSSSWGNHHLRIFTYARLVEKESGNIINTYNCHLDDGSKKAREKSVRQIGEHILNQPSNEPFVFMGDFNAPENSAPIQQLGNFKTQQEGTIHLASDSFRMLHPQKKDVGTYHGYKGTTQGDKIDSIFVPPTTVVSEASIVRTSEQDRYPSDHFPVTATLRFKIIKGL